MLKRGLIFGVGAAITSVLFINFCATMFQCGCQSLWTAAAAFCNVHAAGSRHCPWCAYGTTASLIPYAGMLVAQAAISFWPRPMPAALRLAGAVAAFPIAGAAIAVVYALATGYWVI